MVGKGNREGKITQAEAEESTTKRDQHTRIV